VSIFDEPALSRIVGHEQNPTPLPLERVYDSAVPSQVPVISREQLEALPTRAVLGRLERLRRCELSPGDSDLSAEELAHVAPIRFKSTPEWRTAVDDAKAVLATRENLPSGPERTAARKARGTRGRHR
jgi:hypothetical protein